MPAAGAESLISLSAVALNVDIPVKMGAIAIFLTGLSGANKPSKAFLRSAYRLTPAETRVVFELFDGFSPADIARRSKLSIATVRSQIASVREKTGARNQTDLIRLLAAAQSPVRAR